MREATIKDIARHAEVSISTVSRVMNDNYPVSDEARRRVEEAMEALRYRPNAIARSLRSSRSNMIALVVPDLSNRFFMEAAKGLELETGKAGYNLVIASSGGKAEKENALIDSLVERRVDGLVVAPSDQKGERIRACMEMHIPVVLIDRGIEGLETSQVLWNNFSGAYDLTKILIDHGHTAIGIVNVSLNNVNGAGRLSGFHQAMQDAGLPRRKEYESKSNFCVEEAHAFVKKVLQLPAPPTALFCANNIMVEGALRALQELHLRLYEDISIVAFGNLECNKYLYPRITAADQDSIEMGRRAGLILDDLLCSGKTELTKVVLNAKLTEGGSVRRLP